MGRLLGFSVLGAVLALSGMAQAQSVPLYLEPAETAAEVATVSEDDPVIEAASEVFDETKADQGWMWTEYQGEFTGYVQSGQITKSLEAKPNAVVYLRPDRNSSVMTIVQPEDAIEVVQDMNGWTEVRLSKPVPVYFRQPGAAQPMATPMPLVQSLPVPEQQPVEQTPPPPAPRPQPVQAQPMQPQARPVYTPPQTPATFSLTKPLEGTLKFHERRFGIPVEHNYKLVDSDNKRIAFVDLSGVILNQVDRYLDQPVVVFGQVEKTKNGKLLIRAQSMRRR